MTYSIAATDPAVPGFAVVEEAPYPMAEAEAEAWRDEIAARRPDLEFTLLMDDEP
jgi:hypothetical protein